MHMDQLPAARALVQVVDVLRHDEHWPRPLPLEPSQRQMRRIGLHRRIAQLRPAQVVEAVDQHRVARERLGRGHILEPVALPQPASATKGGQTQLGGNAGARKDHDRTVLHARAHRMPPARTDWPP